MTNEDIRILKVAIENSKEHISFCFDLRGIEALNHAIKALEQQPILDTRQRERQLEMEYQHGYDKGWEEGRKALEQEQKTGHWIIKDGREQGYDIAGIKTWYIQIMCDKCGFIKTAIEGHTGQYHYCPMCGAEMEGEYETDN